MDKHINHLEFKEFLAEMQTTLQEKDLIRSIIHNLVINNKQWFDEQGVVIGNKGRYWILNYQQGTRNEINRLVRGMVVEKPKPEFNGDLLSLIRSFPFTRFFNHGEEDAAHVNFSNSDMLEKMDGSMVAVFFPHKDQKHPEFHTRKMMSTHDEDNSRSLTTFDGKEAKFIPTIRKYVNALRFQEQDVNYTFVFEFVDEISYVLTKYQPHQYGLYLLGARNIQDHRELSENELDRIAVRIGSKRTRRFDTVSDHSEIQKMLDLAAAETPDFEGYVFRDKTTGNRVKVKDSRYVEKHHLLDSLSYKNLIPLILKGEAEEIVTYFPHAKKRIEKFKKTFADYIEKTVKIVQKWQASGLNKRDLSIEIHGGVSPLPRWQMRLSKNKDVKKTTPKEENSLVRNLILKTYDTHNEKDLYDRIKHELKLIALGHNNDGHPKELIQLIGLHDEDVTDTGEI